MKNYSSNSILIKFLAVALPFGLIISKYTHFNHNLPEYSLMSLLAKVVVLILVFLAIYFYAKNESETSSLKLLFRQGFIIVLLGELSIAVADYLSLYHLFPGFIDQFYTANQNWLASNSNWPKEKQTEALAGIQNLKNIAYKDVLLSLLQSVIISAIFAFIFALIIKVQQKKSLQLKQWQNRQQ